MYHSMDATIGGEQINYGCLQEQVTMKELMIQHVG